MRNRFWIARMIASCTMALACFAGGGSGVFAMTGSSKANPAEDAKTVAALDTEYQAAVKRNDVEVIGRILADDFTLVTGAGKTFTKADLLAEARSGRCRWEHQEATMQTVHVWGDTAVVTGKLWVKGTKNGESFDQTLWFSGTYVRTPSGWRYVFGQASLPLRHVTL